MALPESHLESNIDVDLGECASLREQEWQILDSIYPDTTVRSKGPSSEYMTDAEVKLELPIEMEPREVQVVNDGSEPIATQESNRTEKFTLSHLPPLLITLILPATYPLRGQPSIHSVHAPHAWLTGSAMTRLQEQLTQRWDMNASSEDGLLWDTCDWIRNAEFLSDLDLVKHGILTLEHPLPHILIPHLISYNTSASDTSFSSRTFFCEICQEYQKGHRCVSLDCSHVFCRACLEDFWGLSVKEGDVSHVGCADPQCVKEKRPASEEEVRKILTEEEVKRWKWLTEKKAIERDPSIVHCPVRACQGPVPGPKDAEYDDESGWRRLRSCNRCGYNFCSYCRHVWHGPISPCPVITTTGFIRQYLDLPDGSHAKLAIELQFGKNNVAKMVARYKEDMETKAWMEASTMTCPRCAVVVEKSAGCNHMTCTRCTTHFCYRCGQKLAVDNVYAHFSTKGISCYNKLFDFDPADAEWIPMDELP